MQKLNIIRTGTILNPNQREGTTDGTEHTDKKWIQTALWHHCWRVWAWIRYRVHKDALNKLTMNKDVQALVTRIKNDLQTKEFIEEKYDTVLDPQMLSQLIKKRI
jgi:hypothetical protein